MNIIHLHDREYDNINWTIGRMKLIIESLINDNSSSSIDLEDLRDDIDYLDEVLVQKPLSIKQKDITWLT